MQPAVSLHQAHPARARRFPLGRVRFVLPVLLALLLGTLAYQAPLRIHIDVGQLGDQLFIRSSETQREAQIAAGDWYVDQISPELGRSRWSRQRGTITMPGLGQGRDLDLTLTLAGWPANAVRDTQPQPLPDQPTVDIVANGQLVETIQPTPELARYTVTIPGALQSSDPLRITLVSSHTFTNTATTIDVRPKGVRLDAITLNARGPSTPAWDVLVGLALATTLTLGLARSRSRREWLMLLASIGVAVLGATAIVLGRVWLAALLPSIVIALAAVLLLANWRWIAQFIRAIHWRLANSRALDYGLIAAVLAASAYLVVRQGLIAALARGLPTTANPTTDLLLRLSLIGTLIFVLVACVTVLPRWVLLLRHKLITGYLAPIILSLAAGIWLGYELWVIASIPIIGHADYADNAVVARNLLRGRGFVVDYVTQFYWLEPGGSITRPQETWPILQPILMLPSMALLGPTPFAARLPNIIFLAVLTLLIYHIGSRMWDRRVGLLAALLTITNLLFFRLAFYATSDLALVVWSMAAFWLVYRLTMDDGRRTTGSDRSSVVYRPWSIVRSLWFWAGIFTGLMILQKPSSAIFALGMGLWALYQIERQRHVDQITLRQSIIKRWPALALWTVVTLLVVSPYLIRNIAVFGKPFFSTEAHDAWVLYFRGIGGEAWDDLYRVYDPQLGGAGIPDRSWVLRWGWDLTLGKLATQAREAWSFFAPPKGQLLGWDRDGIAATWLLLLGLVGLRRRQRPLIAMVATVLGLYTLFLIVYWHTHDEPRYFVPFVPWLALLAAGGACVLFDRIAAISRGRWAGLAGLLISLALLSTARVHYREIAAALDPEARNFTWQADLQAFAWIEQNTPPDAVIMTGVPWQLNYYADRPALMIPNADYNTIMRLARYYGADYLVLGTLGTRQAQRDGTFGDLQQGEPLPNWDEPVYDRSYNYGPNRDRRVTIYKLPEDYDGAALIEVSQLPAGRN